MSLTFGADFFIGNRQKLRTLFMGTAPIVLTANGLLQKSTDTTYPFTQDSNFWYLTGIEEPNIILVIDKDKEYLIVPEQSRVRAAFDGAINLDAISAISGVSEILNEKDGWKRLGSRVAKSTSAAVLSPASGFIESIGMYTNPAKRNLSKRLRAFNETLTLLDLRQHLQRMRTVKQPLELEAIKKAIDITCEALKTVRAKYQAGKYQNEFEVELDLTKLFNKNGADGHSFEPIIAAGAKACTIHPQGNNSVIDEKHLLLLDVGAAFNHYAADISRTWAARPTKRLSKVHEAVQEVSDYAKSLLKPGVIMKDYEKAVEQFMGEKLRALGLIKSIESEQVRQYFPHSTSHFLGIDVHDVGDYELPLEAGAVLTVEPGIYIPKEGIGVRIEDDVLVTEDGARVLTSKLPSTL